jgi:hypothetical protein
MYRIAIDVDAHQLPPFLAKRVEAGIDIRIDKVLSGDARADLDTPTCSSEFSFSFRDAGGNISRDEVTAVLREARTGTNTLTRYLIKPWVTVGKYLLPRYVIGAASLINAHFPSEALGHPPDRSSSGSAPRLSAG